MLQSYQMRKLITIAGPQSSGKTTLLNFLKKKYKHILLIDEVNPRSLTKNKNFGAADTKADLEKKLIEKDIENINKIKSKTGLVIIESGIYHCVYGEYFIDRQAANYFFRKYLETYKKFGSYTLFIDTKPIISWNRRKFEYLRRIRNNGITNKKEVSKQLGKYKKIIFDLYPIWKKYYKKISFEKRSINNDRLSIKNFLNKADNIIAKFLSSG